MIKLVLCLLFVIASHAAQAGGVPTPQVAQQETPKPSQLSSSDIVALKAKAEGGDAVAQAKLGKAYQDANGVPQNDSLALTWLRKAADQGNAAAENNLGIMYRIGEGVARDKEEAVRWYLKAAKQGSASAMFNLGASYYNGDGVASNEFSAYAWFLLAQEAGDPAANDAVKRTGASMSQKEYADTLLQISAMYEKGEELANSNEQALRWLRKAAEIDSRAKVRLASRLLSGPDASQNYVQALDLCRAAAKDYVSGQYCVGYMYRKGWGVAQDSAEAIKWYQKAAPTNVTATLELAEMHSSGEGTKVDRSAAFLLLLQAMRLGATDAWPKAIVLWKQMNKAELKHLKRELTNRRFDPEKVFAALQSGKPL
jgi:hypothetical protein